MKLEKNRSIEMQKIGWYIIIMVVLIAGAGIIYFTNLRGPFQNDDSDFAVKETNEVTKIVLTSGQEKIELTKTPEGWQVNNKFIAREGSVEFLLQVLSELKIKSPVSNKKFTKETNDRSENVVFVEVFKQLRRIKYFSLYKVTSNTYANYARKREGSNSYVLYIQGYNKPIGLLFVTKEKFWKSYIIFNYQPGMIRQVDMYFPGSPEKSFRIVKAGYNRYKLFRNGKEIPLFDTVEVERYLSYFSNIRFVRWELGMDRAEIDSVISTTPEFVLTVADTAGVHTTIKTYSKLVSLVGRGEGLAASQDEVFVKQDDTNELSVARYYDLDPVIKEIKYFLANGK